MPKLTVIIDINGKVRGTVRSDPVQTDHGEIQFRAPRTDRYAYREIEVPDELLRSEPDQLHARVAELIRSK